MGLIEYLVKFSLWIAASWLFYRVFLTQLTFYNWNRVYLLAYSFLAFFIPFFDLSGIIRSTDAQGGGLILYVPTVSEYVPLAANDSFTPLNIIVAVFVAGMLAALARVLISFLSFRKVSSKAVLLHCEGEVRIYGSENLGGPFSFGNAIYLNHAAHSHEELKRILLHEIVHVKQKHTLDLMLCELVCVVNWFNPFAWMLRKAVKQNLEFIADENVVASGADAKEYQYLLLKVTASPAFHIVSHLNTSNLKKRIAMMNKIKSAKLNLSRFFFTIPLLAVVLVAFRSQQVDTSVESPIKTSVAVSDTVPAETTVPESAEVSDEPTVTEVRHDRFNSKGYALSVITTNGETVVLIQEKNSSKVQAMKMSEWKRNSRENERKYGKLPPPPPPPPAPPAPIAPVAPEVKESQVAPEAPVPPVAPVAPVPPVPPVPAKDAEESRLQNQAKELQATQVKLAARQAIQVNQAVELQQNQVKLVEKQTQLQQEQRRVQNKNIQQQNNINQNRNEDHLEIKKLRQQTND